MNNIRRAIDDYDMISKGDRILVGVSGGKDSMLLFHGLNLLKKYKIYDFYVQGILIDNGYIESIDKLENYYSNKAYPFEVYHEKQILDFTDCSVNCYTCSRLRKGAISRLAKENGFNVIALGHTKDDLVETFLMNLIEKGKIEGFNIKSTFDEDRLSLIRPLIYVDESDVIRASDIIEYPILKSICPLAGKTLRVNYEETMIYMEKKYPNFKDKIINAIK